MIFRKRMLKGGIIATEQLDAIIIGAGHNGVPTFLGGGSHENASPFQIVAMEKKAQANIMHQR